MSDIIIQLSKKSNNKFMIERYIRFIEANKNTGSIQHHILPKAKDLYPEFTNLKINSWNCALVSDRVHFIAHLMLYKIFPNTSMTYCVYKMSHRKELKINSKIYESIKKDFKKRQQINASIQHKNMSNETKKIRNEKISKSAKNLVMAKDENGNIIKVNKELFIDGNFVGQTKRKILVKDKNENYFSVDKDDPRFLSGELTGPNKGKKNPFSTKKGKENHKFGKKISQETKNKMSESMKGIKKKEYLCPYCNKLGRGGGMKLYHFDNCKKK